MNGAFQFAPVDFSDWASLAGFDRKTGQMEDSRVTQAFKQMFGMSDGRAVPPPVESFQDLANQTVGGFVDRMQGVASGAQQLGQGNIVSGVRQIRGAVAPGSQMKMPQVSQPAQTAGPGTPNILYKYSVDD